MNRAKSAKVPLLAPWLIDVMRQWSDQRGEIADQGELVLGVNKLEQRPDVQPLVSCAFEGTIVEVEPVDVCDRSQPNPPDMQKPPCGGFAPRDEVAEVVYR